MRNLIAAFKVSVDGRCEGPAGMADWVDAWSDDYGLTGRIDACVLGGGMYPGYEHYWTAVREAGDAPLPMSGRPASAAERDWCRFAAATPHYVLSSTLASARWTNTTIVRNVDAIRALKAASGKDLYLVGGPSIVSALLELGLVEELHLITYPLLAGPGRSLFPDLPRRRSLALLDTSALPGGRCRTSYRVAS